MTPIIILIAISYCAFKPYKSDMYILHWMEIVSIIGFFVCLIHNMFRAFLYVYDIYYVYPRVQTKLSNDFSLSSYINMGFFPELHC